MADLRTPAILAIAALVAACSSPSSERISDAELAAIAPLKQQYSELVAGLEIRPATTLIVSVDLQNYIEADDARVAAMKREALARWRAAWAAQHPHGHAVLQVRFIDFIGRKVGDEKTSL
ncbi:MAG: hypothetical protein JO113_03275 [Candidatus Eremiobacteraeota bacterium]|nr:hypothetical protein [Candidatus Eremiobacteraeota bacterium]